MRAAHPALVRLIPAFVLWLAWAGNGYGQAESATSQEQFEDVTADRLVALALSRNLELSAARQRLAEAQGLRRQASLRPNPVIDFSVANGDVLNSAGEREYGFNYSHTIELGGKRERRIELADLGLELVKQEVSDRERLLAAEVKLAFANVLAASRNLRDADTLLELTRQNFDLTKARAEAGEGSRLEQGLLEVEVNRMLSDRLRFAADIEGFLFEAKLLAGLAPDTRLGLSGSLGTRPSKPDLVTSVEDALLHRPDLRAARLREQLADAELGLARASGKPNLLASAGYTRAQARFNQYGFSQPGGSLVPLEDSDNLITAGLSIQLPVRDQNQGNIEAAIARQRAARLQREAVEAKVRGEVQAAFSRLESAERALQVLETSVIPQSQENLRVVRGAYELGELRLLDVINEQRRLIEAQRANTELLRDALRASVELERVVGARVN